MIEYIFSLFYFWGSGNALRAEATPVALRRLGDRVRKEIFILFMLFDLIKVRDEWARLYADSEEDDTALIAPAPMTLKF